jgi:hypothetical protein
MKTPQEQIKEIVERYQLISTAEHVDLELLLQNLKPSSVGAWYSRNDTRQAEVLEKVISWLK